MQKHCNYIVSARSPLNICARRRYKADMPTEPATSDKGGSRPNSGPDKGVSYQKTTERSQLVRRVAALEATRDDRKDVSGAVAPPALRVMRQRMNFHLWQFSIIQKKAAGPAGAIIREYTPDEKAEMERHLKEADDAAGRIARYERPMLATVKHINRDDDFDVPLSEIPDDGLVDLAQRLGAVVPPATNDNPGPVAGHGDIDQGGHSPALPAGEGRTAAAG